jgi:hypothetical protein
VAAPAHTQRRDDEQQTDSIQQTPFHRMGSFQNSDGARILTLIAPVPHVSLHIFRRKNKPIAEKPWKVRCANAKLKLGWTIEPPNLVLQGPKRVDIC